MDPRQEFLGLGAANLLAGLWQGFPVAGGLSQSAVNEKGGARTPLSLAFASAVIGMVLLFFTGIFQSLPETVLAGIVLIAVKGLIDLKELRYLWHASRIDFGAAGVAFAGVLLMGVLERSARCGCGDRGDAIMAGVTAARGLPGPYSGNGPVLRHGSPSRE